MYNNEITYHKKWETKYNKRFQRKCMDFISERSLCMCDVPLAWAEEVYRFLMMVEKKYGIAYDLNSYHGYYYSKKLLNLLFKKPFKALFTVPSRQWAIQMSKHYENDGKAIPDSLKKLINPKITCLIKQQLYAFFDTYSHGLKIIYRNMIGTLYNWYRKPLVSIQQVKEKYGTLRIYFDAEEPIEKQITHEIRKLEIALAKKNAYFKLENMVKWSIIYDENGNTVTKFPYKEIIEQQNKESL